MVQATPTPQDLFWIFVTVALAAAAGMLILQGMATYFLGKGRARRFGVQQIVLGLIIGTILALLGWGNIVIPLEVLEILTKAVSYVGAFAIGVGLAVLFFLWGIMKT